MKKFLFQVQINYKRIVFRNLRFLLFSIAMPTGFYLIFTQVITQPAASKTWNIAYMISMIVYSSLISSVMTVAHTLLEDHTRKFDLFVALRPSSKSQYYLSMLIVFLSLNILSVLALIMTGILVNQLTINWFHLIGLLFLVPLLSFPLILIGMIISLLGSDNVVNLLSNLIVFPMAILSGLWWPLSIMPPWVQKVGHWLPTYQTAVILRRFINYQRFNFVSFGVLLVWTIILFVLFKVVVFFQSKSEVSTI